MNNNFIFTAAIKNERILDIFPRLQKKLIWSYGGENEAV